MTGLAVACAVLIGLGGSVVTLAVAPDPDAGRGTPTVPATRSRQRLHHLGLRLGLAVGAAAAVGVVTGWPAAAGWFAVLGFCLPGLFGTGHRRAVAAARIEAVAVWAEMLRDQAAAGADLAQAVQASAAHAPAPIAPPVARLAIRLRRQPPEEALAAFADEVADPTADLVVAALTVAFAHQARRVGELLSALAASAREQASMRLRVERDRARIRTVARSTGAVVLGWTALVYTFSGRFFEAYDDATGQLVLAVVGGFFAIGLAGLTRLDRLPRPERLRGSSIASGSHP